MTTSHNYFQQWTHRYPTEFWHDSAEPAEIRRAVTWGAVGVTTNPVLMYRAARASAARWDVEIEALKRENPDLAVEDICWALVRGIAQENAAILAPVYDRLDGHSGRICVQVDPTKHDDAAAMIAQGAAINRWAKNLLIKIPVTAAGLIAIEGLTAQGISTVGTLSYSVPQVVGIAEAYRRGLALARRNGGGSKRSGDTRRVRNYAVIMTGRLDDHLRDVVREGKLDVPEALINHAGEAVTKKAWEIFRARRYESALLLASFRPYHDPGDFIGGAYAISVPLDLQDKVLVQGTPLKAGIESPVPADVLQALAARLPDLARAYEEDGMQPGDFATFGPVVKTLAQFIGGYRDLQAQVRERMAAL